MINKFYVGLIFIFSIVLSIAFFIFEDFFQETSSFGLIGIFLVNLISSASLFVSGPAFLTVIAGGSIYSPILVAIIASIGAAIGDMVSFVIGYSGRKLTRERLEKNPKILFIEKHFKKHGWLIIFAVALIPNPFFDAVGIIAGVLNYSPLHFFLLMLLARFLRYLLLAQFGATL